MVWALPPTWIKPRGLRVEAVDGPSLVIRNKKGVESALEIVIRRSSDSKKVMMAGKVMDEVVT